MTPTSWFQQRQQPGRAAHGVKPEVLVVDVGQIGAVVTFVVIHVTMMAQRANGTLAARVTARLSVVHHHKELLTGTLHSRGSRPTPWWPSADSGERAMLSRQPWSGNASWLARS